MDYAPEIRQYIVSEFIPDIEVDELDDDYNLIASGVIDSLSLLRIITWLETEFGIPVDEIEIAENNFASVTEICALVAGGVQAMVSAESSANEGVK